MSRPTINDVDAGERPAPPARGSFGQWLRGQREARGVSLPEIAESSKISMRYLEALEHDRFEVLPAPVFVRGFLREYARVVGLDADEVVNLFLVAVPRAPVERRLESAGGRLSSSSRSHSGGSSVGRGLVVTIGVLIVLGIAAGLAYWATRRSSAAPTPDSAVLSRTAPDQPAAAPAVPAATPDSGHAASGGVAQPVETPASQAGAEAERQVAAPQVVAPPPLAPVPITPSQAAAATPAVAAAGPLVVVLAFQQDCWVETRVDGGRRASELKAGGETLTLEAKESIVLTLGNAPAVRAELNGRPLALPADSTRLLREFRIDRSLIADPNPPERPQPSQP